MGMKATKFYGVATLTGGAVFASWDEVTGYLRENPGPEFHKKFDTEQAAWEFVETKRSELTGTTRTPRQKVQYECEPCVTTTALGVEEDGPPPWD